jgi:hypothetical protein
MKELIVERKCPVIPPAVSESYEFRRLVFLYRMCTQKNPFEVSLLANKVILQRPSAADGIQELYKKTTTPKMRRHSLVPRVEEHIDVVGSRFSSVE